ncbi:hypothetical protein CEXT_727451, partial [Caerostris extrusa]
MMRSEATPWAEQ